LESVSSAKTETRVAAGEVTWSEAHTTTPLGTLQNARSQVELGMWRCRARRGRAGQAFKLGGPDVTGGATAKFIRRGLSRAATGWPGCQDEAPEAELLAVLDQGLEPTRAR
jgi:alpha-D-ribose 1-methylphosphonate 5-triphosphate synthase subunit PhnG